MGQDIDFCLGDSDMDSFIRECGGIMLDGIECKTSISLKRHSYEVYCEKRKEIVSMIVSEVKSGVESGFLPMQVPFTYNVIECNEQ